MRKEYAAYGLIGLLVLVVVLLFIPTKENEGMRSGPKIIVLGDSLTSGVGIAVENSFPEKLQSAFDKEKIEVNIINAGVSGDTTEGGLSRLGSVIGQKPVAVIIELGANDMLRLIDPDITRSNLETIIKTLEENNIKVMLAGMQALPNLDGSFQNKFNSIFPDLAQKNQIAFYPFFLDGVAGNAAMNQPDGAHPNELGIDEIVKRSFPYVREFVDTLK